MRQFARNSGYMSNSHGLVHVDSQLLVPDDFSEEVVEWWVQHYKSGAAGTDPDDPTARAMLLAKAADMRRLQCALRRIGWRVRTDEDVFALIGLPYVHPHHRNFGP
jgi:hypothetical protein